MARKFLLGFGEAFAGFEQGFTGNATDSKASASERGSLLNTAHIETQLGRANGSDVAAWTSSNDD